jgi:hypothetical protein
MSANRQSRVMSSWLYLRHLQHYQQLFFGSQLHRNQSYSGKRLLTIYFLRSDCFDVYSTVIPFVPANLHDAPP